MFSPSNFIVFKSHAPPQSSAREFLLYSVFQSFWDLTCNMGSDLDFSGKRVLITGGGQGIGLAMVKTFLQHNATVVVLDKDESLLETLLEENPSVIGVKVDLACWEATTKAVESVLPIHHLVNNAGIFDPLSFLDVTEEDIDKTFNVNFKAYVHVAQVVAKDMIKNKIEGTIVNISSVADHQLCLKDGGLDMYCCSKAAVSALTKVLGLELISFGIRVNTIRPGLVQTEIGDGAPEEGQAALNAMLDRLIYKRKVKPGEVGDAALFLSSKLSGMVHGTSLTVDGGYEVY